MHKINQMPIYLLLNIIAFYILPHFAQNTTGFIIVMLLIIPLTCFITALLFGKKYGFSLLYVLLIPILFIPTIFIYYNDTATIYIAIYGGTTLVANFLGSLIYRKQKKRT